MSVDKNIFFKEVSVDEMPDGTMSVGEIARLVGKNVSMLCFFVVFYFTNNFILR